MARSLRHLPGTAGSGGCSLCAAEVGRYHPVRLPWAFAPKRLGNTQVDIPASARCDAEQIGRAHVELQSLMRISYAVFCLKKKNKTKLLIAYNRFITILKTNGQTNT